MKFTKFKLYFVKALRIAFTTVAWLDFYCMVTSTPILGFTRTFGNLVTDSVTAFLLFCWENNCYEEYCYGLAEEEMNKQIDAGALKTKAKGKVKFLHPIDGKKDDKNE